MILRNVIHSIYLFLLTVIKTLSSYDCYLIIISFNKKNYRKLTTGYLYNLYELNFSLFFNSFLCLTRLYLLNICVVFQSVHRLLKFVRRNSCCYTDCRNVRLYLDLLMSVCCDSTVIVLRLLL